MRRAQAGASVRSLFAEAVSALREAGVQAPETDARILLGHALGLSREALAARPDRAVTPLEADRVLCLVARRQGRQPVSRILGRREFFGLDFLLGAETLDPRPDSETLIEVGLASITGTVDGPLRILDIGTGTGCLLLSLLHALRSATGVGVDIAPGALAVAALNANRLGLAERARWLRSDFLDAVTGEFNLIVSNPPYIPSATIATLEPEVSHFDPRLALDGGPDGLSAYRRIAPALRRVLVSGGTALLEIDAPQFEGVRRVLTDTGLDPARIKAHSDLSGRARVVEARAPQTHEAQKKLGKAG